MRSIMLKAYVQAKFFAVTRGTKSAIMLGGNKGMTRGAPALPPRW